jgi:hypothetical protein
VTHRGYTVGQERHPDRGQAYSRCPRVKSHAPLAWDLGRRRCALTLKLQRSRYDVPVADSKTQAVGAIGGSS